MGKKHARDGKISLMLNSKIYFKHGTSYREDIDIIENDLNNMSARNVINRFNNMVNYDIYWLSWLAALQGVKVINSK